MPSALGVPELPPGSIVSPPEPATVTVGSNATFSCTAVGEVVWRVNDRIVDSPILVNAFASIGILVPFPIQNHSVLTVITSSDTIAVTNGTTIQCMVIVRMFPGGLPIFINSSGEVHLFITSEFIIVSVKEISQVDNDTTMNSFILLEEASPPNHSAFQKHFLASPPQSKVSLDFPPN